MKSNSHIDEADEKYSSIFKIINDLYEKMDKMDKKINNSMKWVANMCIATIVGIIIIVLSMSAITYAIINKLLK